MSYFVHLIRDAPHTVAPVDVLPTCPERLVETRPRGQKVEDDQADGAVFRTVLLEYSGQPLQLPIVQVVLDLVVGVEEMHSRGRISVQHLPFDGQVERMAQEPDEVVCVGR